MTNSQAAKIVEMKLTGEERKIGRDIMVRPFLSKKAWLIGPRGRVRIIWYKSNTSSTVEMVGD